MENPFSLKEKIEGQTPNQFTIIKSITIILMYVSRLKKNLFFFFSHTQIISLKGGNTLLSPFYFLLHAWLFLGCLLSLSGSLLDALSILLCGFLFLCFLPSETPFFLSWFHPLYSLSP